MTTAQITKSHKGFTLIELLVVIGILATLLAITLIAINPARQFAQANNTKRRSDVLQLLNAVHQYAAENQGQFPTGLTASAAAAPIADTGTDICTAIMPTYISALPTDPSLNTNPVTDCATYDTGYTVARDAQGRITVAAPSAELGQTISVVR
ncbi:MAG: type pilus assembly protein PilA [Patescibacteria group bacterium]|jgi:type IV pilus assembly protein PilA|nr:type pilus assembly protein PilA [Patescibacteria group bacterium]